MTMNHKFNARLCKLPWCAECLAPALVACTTPTGHVCAPHRVRLRVKAGSAFTLPVETARKLGLTKKLRAAMLTLGLLVVGCGDNYEPTVDATIHVFADDAAPDAPVLPDATVNACCALPTQAERTSCFADELPEGTCAILACPGGGVAACHQHADAGVDAP